MVLSIYSIYLCGPKKLIRNLTSSHFCCLDGTAKSKKKKNKMIFRGKTNICLFSELSSILKTSKSKKMACSQFVLFPF